MTFARKVSGCIIIYFAGIAVGVNVHANHPAVTAICALVVLLGTMMAMWS